MSAHPPIGVLTADDIGALAAAGAVRAPGLDARIQPASLDLSLGAKAWRVRAAFLPGADRRVSKCLDAYALHDFSLEDGAVLERGCTYVVPLREALTLSASPLGRLSATANPKSSTGRIDVFVRLVTDHATSYERVPAGYDGPLYAEISPRTFSVLVREGSSLNQLRLRTGEAGLDDEGLRARHAASPLSTGGTVGEGLRLSVDLRGEGVVGYRARRHAGLIDVDRVGALDPDDYWEPMEGGGALILDPGEFYILASREELAVPRDLAAEMVAIDTELGAFRAHYAGFFDPGFGTEAPSRAVLEVRGFDTPFALEHGQTVARLTYERLTGAVRTGYGAALRSNYQGQGLRLSKHFRQASLS